MSVNEGVVYAMALFMALGAADRICGGRFGLAERFEEGIMAMGALTLSMAGVICLAPVLAGVLRPVVVPVYAFLGADPAMFAGTILANDMGGAALAAELAGSPEAGQFGGLLVGSMLGATVVFTIPVGLGIIRPEDRPYLAKGVLAGVVVIPLGALAGGLTAGFGLLFLLKNLLPIVIIAALIVLGLWFAPGGMIRGFTLFGKGVTAVATAGLAIGILQALTPLVLLPGLNPLGDALATVGEIAIVLAGAFPLVFVVTKLFQKPLMGLGRVLGVNDRAAAGLVATLANNIPMFGMLGEMDPRGKVVNVAFAVCAAFVFGDHLGFTAGYAPEMIVPMIVGKLTGGIAAVPVALLLAKGEGNGQK